MSCQTDFNAQTPAESFRCAASSLSDGISEKVGSLAQVTNAQWLDWLASGLAIAFCAFLLIVAVAIVASVANQLLSRRPRTDPRSSEATPAVFVALVSGVTLAMAGTALVQVRSARDLPLLVIGLLLLTAGLYLGRLTWRRLRSRRVPTI